MRAPFSLASAALLAFRAAAAVSLSVTTPVETSAASGTACTSALPAMFKVRAGTVCADAGGIERNSAAVNATHARDRCLLKGCMSASFPVIRIKSSLAGQDGRK